jgi:hypothetical protein
MRATDDNGGPPRWHMRLVMQSRQIGAGIL